MSINTVKIYTQYEENYAHHEGGFHWKKKGGFTFQIEMDADLLLYTNPEKVFGKMLESQNSDIERFTYVDYEIEFQTPTVLGTQADYIDANASLEEAEDDFNKALEDVNPIIGGVDFSDSLDALANLTILGDDE